MADDRVLYLLDASSYIHRAFHAIRNLSTSEGVPTNAVFGFTQMLLKVIKEAQPAYLAVVYDAKGPTFRHKMYPFYKANRPEPDPALRTQFPLVRQVVTALSLPAVEMEGYEADDLMATLARLAREQGFQVILVSGDKDLLQLVGPGVTLWDTMKEVRLGPAEVREKLGVTPEQAIDLQALSGDSTDNVPGVPGVGPKTAAKLLNEYGSLDAVLEAAPEMKKSKLRDNLLAHRDQALLSRRLVALATDAPLTFEPAAFRVVEPDPAVLTPILAKLEFTRLLKEFAPPAPSPKSAYRLVTKPADLKAVIAEARTLGRLSVDTETTSTEPMRARLVGFSLAHTPHEGIYVPVGHNLPAAEQMDLAQAKKLLGAALADPGLPKIGQNLKYDLTVLERAGMPARGVAFDTMVADYLLNPGKASHGLTALAGEHLGRSVIPFEEATGGKDKSFADAPLDKAVDYAAEDADVALQLALKLEPELKDAGLWELFADLEMPLVPVLARMERAGVRLDAGQLGELSKEMEGQLVELEASCYRLAGREFNLNSPQQLATVLFEELGLSQVKKTKKKTGYSTDMTVLTILAKEHELPAEILNYRTLTKIKSTYVDILPGLIHPDTGRVHTSFNQTVAATGRLSSSDPNLQNIPVRSDLGLRIRQCFVPEPGKLMLSADYSQIELRVLAHLSEDPLLLADMASGLDVHTQTASRIFDIPPDKVTREMRARAKTVNFGVLYGMSAFRLAREQGVSRAEAQDIIEKYLGRYQGIAAFQAANLAQARDRGYVTTLLGRRRFLPAINSSDRIAREAAERVALNTPIQGSAADLIKLAMLEMDRIMAKNWPEALMILQVHDELVFEVPWMAVEQFAQVVRETMEGVGQLKVALKVDLGWGNNWAEAH
ncbi:MAG: DNA polymerase I [Deltaproteobacteria bacterium]|nr:DNA polymerase I [Deltaproteobacteria bacterium]